MTPPCPRCSGTGDEWHQPIHGEPSEPYPCSACRGTGDAPAPRAERSRGADLNAGLDLLLFSLCGSPGSLLELEMLKASGVFEHEGSNLGISPRDVEAAVCRVMNAEQPLPF